MNIPPRINGDRAATLVSFVVLGADANGTNPGTGKIPHRAAVTPNHTVLFFTVFGELGRFRSSDIPFILVAKFENNTNSPIRHVIITLGSTVGVPQAKGRGTARNPSPDEINSGDIPRA